MLSKTLFIILLMLFTTSVVANDHLKAYLPETCYQTGEFEQQKPLANTSKLLTTQGRFAFACDKGLVWHIQSPLIETSLYQLNGRHWLKSGEQEMHALTGKIHRHMGNILNQLIGGNQAYLHKHFAITTVDNVLELTPRQSRMKKFLLGIQITRDGQDVNINMLQKDNSFTAVRIFNIRNRSSLNEIECHESTQSHHEVCQKLFGL